MVLLTSRRRELICGWIKGAILEFIQTLSSVEQLLSRRNRTPCGGTTADHLSVAVPRALPLFAVAKISNNSQDTPLLAARPIDLPPLSSITVSVCSSWWVVIPSQAVGRSAKASSIFRAPVEAVTLSSHGAVVIHRIVSAAETDRRRHRGAADSRSDRAWKARRTQPRTIIRNVATGALAHR